MNTTPPALHLLPVQQVSASGYDHLIIRPIGDVHIGNPAFDSAYWERLLREVRDTPNMYWIGVGDYIENANKRQKHGAVYHTPPPSRQAREFVEQVAPIAGKCLGLIGGNHDFWTKDDSDFDPVEQIAERLGLADRYGEDGLVVRLETGSRTKPGRRDVRGSSPCRYTLYVTHGSSGSALVSGKALALERAGNACLADVIVGGHVHSEIVFKSLIYTPQWSDKVECSYREVVYVNSGSLLNYTAYARRARYRPQPVGIPYILLATDREKVRVQTG